MKPDPETYTVRPAVAADRDAIVALVRTSLRELGLEYAPETSESDLNDIQHTYLEGGGIFLVAVTPNGQIVGTAGLLILAPGKGKIRKMYVAGTHRGQGLGKQMLGLILTYARQQKLSVVVLETMFIMHQAIGLYEAFGFERVAGGSTVSPRCELLMEKKL